MKTKLFYTAFLASTITTIQANSEVSVGVIGSCSWQRTNLNVKQAKEQIAKHINKKQREKRGLEEDAIIFVRNIENEREQLKKLAQDLDPDKMKKEVEKRLRRSLNREKVALEGKKAAIEHEAKSLEKAQKEFDDNAAKLAQAQKELSEIDAQMSQDTETTEPLSDEQKTERAAKKQKLEQDIAAFKEDQEKAAQLAQRRERNEIALKTLPDLMKQIAEFRTEPTPDEINNTFMDYKDHNDAISSQGILQYVNEKLRIYYKTDASGEIDHNSVYLENQQILPTSVFFRSIVLIEKKRTESNELNVKISECKKEIKKFKNKSELLDEMKASAKNDSLSSKEAGILIDASTQLGIFKGAKLGTHIFITKTPGIDIYAGYRYSQVQLSAGVGAGYAKKPDIKPFLKKHELEAYEELVSLKEGKGLNKHENLELFAIIKADYYVDKSYTQDHELVIFAAYKKSKYSFGKADSLMFGISKTI